MDRILLRYTEYNEPHESRTNEDIIKVLKFYFILILLTYYYYNQIWEFYLYIYNKLILNYYFKQCFLTNYLLIIFILYYLYHKDFEERFTRRKWRI